MEVSPLSSNPVALMRSRLIPPQYLESELTRGSRCWGNCDQVLVGGTGHYLNSQIELAGGVLELVKANGDRLEGLRNSHDADALGRRPIT